MTYPIEILPSPQFKRELKIDEFPEGYAAYIHRKSEEIREKCFAKGIEDVVHLMPKVITYLLGLSVNLLGGEFKPQVHAIWRQLGDGTLPWKGEEIDLRKYSSCYVPVSDDYPDFFFPVKSLHHLVIEYPRSFNKEKDLKGFHIVQDVMDDINKKEKEEGKNTWNPKKIVEGYLLVSHKPTKLNYWHYEVECWTRKDNGDELVKNLSSEWKKKFIGILHESLLSCILFKEPAITPLPADAYYETPQC